MTFAVFDCDGTLVDSQFVIAQSMNRTFADFSLPELEVTKVRTVIGLHLPEAIERLAPDAPEGVTYDEMAEVYKKHFFAIRTSEDFYEPLFENVVPVLQALAEEGITIGMATGKSRRGVESVLEHHGLTELFQSLKTSDDGPGKPHPQILLDAMREIGARPEETILIGDTTFDMELAKNAGAHALGVTWGYHARAELEQAGAELIIDHFTAVPEALARLSAAPEGTGA